MVLSNSQARGVSHNGPAQPPLCGDVHADSQLQSQEQEKVRWQEQRKSMQEDAKIKAELAQYQDQLARKRSSDEHEKNRERNAELVRMQEQSSAKQEQQRAQTEAQIQAERRASEKYKVPACTILPSCPVLGQLLVCSLINQWRASMRAIQEFKHLPDPAWQGRASEQHDLCDSK